MAVYPSTPSETPRSFRSRLAWASLRLLLPLSAAGLLVVAVACGGLFRCYRQGRVQPVGERVITDVTQLVALTPDQVVRPTRTQEVQELLTRHRGPISIGGGRFSQGGQIGVDGTLFVDTRDLNDVLSIDVDGRTIRVEAGITWRAIQEAIDPYDLSLRIMQSYANFTVGGSISVNAHGRYVNEGPLVHAVRSLVVVTPDGAAHTASRTENAELFAAVVGGYGAFGVVTEAVLDLVANEPVERTVERMDVAEFWPWFEANIRGNPDAVFFNADIYPPDYSDVAAITFSRTDRAPTVADRLQAPGPSTAADKVGLWWVSEAPLGKEARAEIIDRMRLAGKPVVWRNYEASYDARTLEPGSRAKQTYVLQEYFVPVDHFDGFAAKMAEIFVRYEANILNVSIRHATADTETLLSWAPTECFAFVIYYKQGTDDAHRTEVGVWTRELIDEALSAGGTYYLPYQIIATETQFHRGYPGAAEAISLKQHVDPQYQLRNTLWDRYLPPYGARAAETELAAVREQLVVREGYARPESQTFLTLPEWYIVYSADDLAAHLSAGGAPSAFPYFESVCDFCRLYGAVVNATRGRFDDNSGYHAMIGVIGASYIAEMSLKGLYEATIGRLFEGLGGYGSSQDTAYAAYATEYGAFLHHTPWYAFPFADTRGRLPDEGGLRGWERHLALTGELVAKSWWGGAMSAASGAAYGDEIATIQALVRPNDMDAAAVPGVQSAEGIGKGLVLLTVERYEPFTSAIATLVAGGADIVEVAGAERIVVQVTAPRTRVDGSAWDGDLWGDVVFAWPLRADPARQRVALEVPIRRLNAALPGLEASGARLERLYDY